MQALFDRWQTAYERDKLRSGGAGAAPDSAGAAGAIGKEAGNYLTLLSYLTIFEVA